MSSSKSKSKRGRAKGQSPLPKKTSFDDDDEVSSSQVKGEPDDAPSSSQPQEDPDLVSRYPSYDFADLGDGAGEDDAPSSSQAQDHHVGRGERLGKRLANRVEADLSGDLDAGPSSSRRCPSGILSGDDGNESDGSRTTVSSVVSAVTLGTASAISMSIDALRSQLTWIQHRLRPAFEVADGKNSTPEDTERYEKLKVMEADARTSLVEVLKAV
ncbi:hypothetical protein BGX31_005548, partial [Mortierella sp. GBA43]